MFWQASQPLPHDNLMQIMYLDELCNVDNRNNWDSTSKLFRFSK